MAVYASICPLINIISYHQVSSLFIKIQGHPFMRVLRVFHASLSLKRVAHQLLQNDFQGKLLVVIL